MGFGVILRGHQKVHDPRPPRGRVPWMCWKVHNPRPPCGRVPWISQNVHDPRGGNPVQGGGCYKVMFILRLLQPPLASGEHMCRDEHNGVAQVAAPKALCCTQGCTPCISTAFNAGSRSQHAYSVLHRHLPQRWPRCRVHGKSID